jgi:hypothetical protein
MRVNPDRKDAEPFCFRFLTRHVQVQNTLNMRALHLEHEGITEELNTRERSDGWNEEKRQSLTLTVK